MTITALFPNLAAPQQPTKDDLRHVKDALQGARDLLLQAAHELAGAAPVNPEIAAFMNSLGTVLVGLAEMQIGAMLAKNNESMSRARL